MRSEIPAIPPELNTVEDAKVRATWYCGLTLSSGDCGNLEGCTKCIFSTEHWSEHKARDLLNWEKSLL